VTVELVAPWAVTVFTTVMVQVTWSAPPVGKAEGAEIDAASH
jgi:hypothetical protein